MICFYSESLPFSYVLLLEIDWTRDAAGKAFSVTRHGIDFTHLMTTLAGAPPPPCELSHFQGHRPTAVLPSAGVTSGGGAR